MSGGAGGGRRAFKQFLTSDGLLERPYNCKRTCKGNVLTVTGCPNKFSRVPSKFPAKHNSALTF